MNSGRSAIAGPFGIVSVMAALASTTALATEGGGTSKVLGVDTVLSGVMPAPGVQLTTFLARYEASETTDSAGNGRPGISGFDLGVNALTFRVQYVWKDTKLWGADIESRVGFTAYANGDVSFDVATPGGRLHRSGSSSGIGDALLAPVLLGWHSDTFHQIAGLELFLPTGKFDATKLANNSRGYYAAAPAYWFTWFPTPAVEVSGALVYLYNRENPDTKYTSGRELSFDYGIGYAVNRNWQAGVSGYLYKQITDDRVNGNVVGDGNRGQVAAIGPFLRYTHSKNLGVTLKWQIEGDVRNKTQGNRFFLQFAQRFD